MIELKTTTEQLESCANNLSNRSEMGASDFMRDAAADIKALNREVLDLKVGRDSLGKALFEMIEPQLEIFYREKPTKVDVMTMRSVVYDMVNEGEILVEVDTSDISITVDTIDLSANVDSLELSLANDR